MPIACLYFHPITLSSLYTVSHSEKQYIFRDKRDLQPIVPIKKHRQQDKANKVNSIDFRFGMEFHRTINCVVGELLIFLFIYLPIIGCFHIIIIVTKINFLCSKLLVIHTQPKCLRKTFISDKKNINTKTLCEFNVHLMHFRCLALTVNRN